MTVTTRPSRSPAPPRSSLLLSDERTRLVWIVLAGLVVSLLATTVVTSQTMWAMRDHGHDWWRMFLWQATCWGFWAALAPLAVAHGRRLLDPRTRPFLWPLRLLGWAALSTAANTALTALAFRLLQPYVPVDRHGYLDGLLEHHMPLVRIGPLIYGIEVVVGYGLGGYLEARRAELRRSRLEADLARAQLDALRLEIQPHFLFNSLNSIAAQVRLGADDEALEMLVALSDLLRATLERRERSRVPLAEEVELLRRYVALQRGRFGDRLSVELAIDADCLGRQVPLFLLQPLVENSIVHGLGRRAGALHLEVAGRCDDGRLTLAVRDDGPGLPEPFDLEAVDGLGLKNVRSRLARLYGSAAALELARRPEGGVEAIVTLPVPAADGEALPS